MTGAKSAVRLPVQLCVYRKGPLQQCGGLFLPQSLSGGTPVPYLSYATLPVRTKQQEAAMCKHGTWEKIYSHER